MGSYEDVLKSATNQSSNKNILFQFSKTYPAWVIFIITLALSFVLWQFIEQQVNNENQNNFEKASSSLMVRLEEKYQSEIQVLNSIKPVFKSFVVRDAFELNAKSPVNADTVIRTIMKVTEVDTSYYDDFIYNTRSQGYYDLKIHPEQKRDIYNIVEYVVPFEVNQDRSGYDFSSEPEIAKLFRMSAKDDEILMSPIYDVRPDTLGFYMLAPVYRAYQEPENESERMEHFEGALLLEIKVPSFFQAAIGEGIASDSTIIYDIIDNNSPRSDKSFYQSNNYFLLTDEFIPLLRDNKTLEIGGKNIDVMFYTVPEFGGFQNNLPIISLIIGIVVSFVLFGFIISVITSRQRALELAEQMTKSQRRIVESSQDIIAVLDFNGIWKTMNPASEEIFNQGTDELIGSSIDELFQDKKDTHIFYKIIESGLDDYTERVDLKMLARGNKKKWLNWSFTVSHQDSLVYAIGRDVTLQKEAEAQQRIRNKQVELAERFSREASESKTYFMTTLSHQLRNSLTGILGYLQMAKEGFYENTEELNSFLELAEQSSEEIFTFVADYVDMTIATDSNTKNIDFSTVKIKENYENVLYKLGLEDKPLNIKTEFIEETPNSKFLGDKNIMSETLMIILKTLAEGNAMTNVTIQATENSYEKATELQILGSENSIVEEMIKIYKQEKRDIVDALEKDKKDVLLSLATIESNIRRLNGSIQFETFGGEEGNVVMITLPLTATTAR
ncbi:CHASE domain-containing protein [Candidatus Kapabacteria bacterium]|nr:CHASE domain-containing protein [Candidatus Kapabacteria bacterium]